MKRLVWLSGIALVLVATPAMAALRIPDARYPTLTARAANAKGVRLPGGDSNRR